MKGQWPAKLAVINTWTSFHVLVLSVSRNCIQISSSGLRSRRRQILPFDKSNSVEFYTASRTHPACLEGPPPSAPEQHQGATYAHTHTSLKTPPTKTTMPEPAKMPTTGVSPPTHPHPSHSKHSPPTFSTLFQFVRGGVSAGVNGVMKRDR